MCSIKAAVSFSDCCSYYVCEKSDGIRCLLYFTRSEVEGELHYLIDRMNNYYYVPNLHFPLAPEKPDGPIDFPSYHVNTIIDGELLYDEYPDGRKILKFVVFDCLLLDEVQLMQRTLDKRLAYFKEKVFKPYEELCRHFPESAAQFVFKMEEKSFQLGYGVVMMFTDIIPALPHGSDGLIFTCRETPYKFGTDDHILKWKPADENTIDFKLGLEFPPMSLRRVSGTSSDMVTPYDENDEYEEGWAFDYGGHPTMMLYVLHSERDYRSFAQLYTTDAEWDSMKRYAIERNDGLDGQIVECHKDMSGRWRFNRFRDDKREANHITTVIKVLESIDDGVSKEDLVRVAGQVRTAMKRRAAETEQRRQDAMKRMAEKRREDEAKRAQVTKREEGLRRPEETPRAPSVKRKLDESGQLTSDSKKTKQMNSKAMRGTLQEKYDNEVEDHYED